MAYASSKVVALGKVSGCFTHVETGVIFEYSKDTSLHGYWYGDERINGVVFVDDIFCNTRLAIIKKTVAHVVTDEDSTGRPIFEKWPIRHHIGEYGK